MGYFTDLILGSIIGALFAATLFPGFCTLIWKPELKSDIYCAQHGFCVDSCSIIEEYKYCQGFLKKIPLDNTHEYDIDLELKNKIKQEADYKDCIKRVHIPDNSILLDCYNETRYYAGPIPISDSKFEFINRSWVVQK